MSDPGESAADPRAPLPVREVATLAAFGWLARGWRDFTGAFRPSILHGLAVTLGGLAILFVSLHFWPLLPGAFSGFVLVGPILATGLYELSRRREAGEDSLTLAHAIGAWRRGTLPLVALGVLLTIAATLWVAVTAVLVHLFVTPPPDGLDDFLRRVVLAPQPRLLAVWLVAGGVGAALVFAATAISPPLLLDRAVGLRAAVATSVHAAARNPLALGVWAAAIMVLTALSMATLMLGFAIAIPVIGHASWHACRDLVDTTGVPRRE